MTTLSSFAKLIDSVSEPFGGYSQVINIVPTKVLEYLVQFPGFVIIVKPWATPMDLLELGYTPGLPYKVFDYKMRLLYSHTPSDAKFGGSADVPYLQAVPNGSLLHLQIPTEVGTKLGLVWVCNELSPQKIEQQIEKWKKEFNEFNKPVTTNELFIGSNLLNQDNSKLNFYYVAGTLSEQLSAGTVKTHKDVVLSSYQVGDYITIYPKRTGWYVFQLEQDGETIDLTVQDIIGQGYQKVKYINGCYYIELQNSSLSNLYSIKGLSTADSRYSFYEDSLRIQIQAELFYRHLAIAEGSTVIDATANTLQHVEPLLSQDSGALLTAASIITIYSKQPDKIDVLENDIFKEGFFGIEDPLEGDIFYGRPSGDDGETFGGFAIGSTIIYMDPEVST